MKTVQLRNDVQLPMIGAGTWKITDREQMKDVVRTAYQCGYRLFDSAAAYYNEMVLGKAFAELQLPRDKIIMQDKLWNTCYGYENAQTACKRSLKKLKMEYLDVYLVHWPASSRQYDNWEEINAETWRGMEQLYKDGLVRAIGVCNFKINHLEALAKTASILPFINQIECHPGMPGNEIAEYCIQRKIQIQASSPLGNGQILNNEVILKIAKDSGISAAQLCLKWGIEHGYIVLPKTVNHERLRENINLDNISLNAEIMYILDNMPFCGGLAIDSEEVGDLNGL